MKKSVIYYVHNMLQTCNIKLFFKCNSEVSIMFFVFIILTLLFLAADDKRVRRFLIIPIIAVGILNLSILVGTESTLMIIGLLVVCTIYGASLWCSSLFILIPSFFSRLPLSKIDFYPKIWYNICIVKSHFEKEEKF